MVDVTIGAIPNAAQALGDTDLYEIEQTVAAVQTSGKVTGAQLKAYVSGGRTAVSVLSIAAGVVNINYALGDYFTLALTANVTSITFSNLPAAPSGASIAIRFRQDGTGGRTVAFPASFKATGGSDTTVQSAINAYTLLILTSFDQGTRWEYAMQEIAA